MKNVQTIRKLIALCAALALLLTAGVSAFAQDNGTTKHFSVIEAASDENALSIAEIVAKNRTSVVAIETETKIVYNDNYYNNPFGASPFGGLFGSSPIMPVHDKSAERFVARGGRIPAPLHSLKN